MRSLESHEGFPGMSLSVTQLAETLLVSISHLGYFSQGNLLLVTDP